MARGTYEAVYIDQVLAAIGAPRNAATRAFLASWAAREGVPQQVDAYNLWGTTLKVGSSYGTNGPGVQSYRSQADGVRASASMLQQSNFTGILAALRSGNPSSYQSNPSVQAEFRSWSGGGYSWPVGSSTTAVAAPTAPGLSASRTRPETPSGGGSGVGGWGSLLGVAEGPLSTLLGPFGGIVGLFSGASSVADVLKSILWLVDPKSWLRMVEFLTGGLLMLFSLIGLATVFMARTDTAQSIAGPASVLPGPAGVVARGVSIVGRPKRAAARETRGYVKRRTTPSPEARRASIRARTRQIELDRQARDEERKRVHADAIRRVRPGMKRLARTGTGTEIS